jgi:hypothetical protein
MKPFVMKPISILSAALLLSVVLPTLGSKVWLTAAAQTAQKTTRPSYTNTKVIALGTNLRVRLNNGLSSKEARAGDRFTAEVVTPSRYEGAVVAGHIGSIKKSGRVKGRTSMALAFDSIQLRDGRKATMHGQLMRLYGEDSTKVDEEGNAQSGSRGNQTLKRSGIGAAAGAVVGGLIGGGKGVAAGLIIGGAAGAGSIAVQGSKELRLESGTEMLVKVTRR